MRKYKVIALSIVCIVSGVQASSNLLLTACEVTQALIVAKPHWRSAYDIYKTPAILDQELENADPIVIDFVRSNAMRMNYSNFEKIIVKRGSPSKAALYGQDFNSFCSSYYTVIIPDYACDILESKADALILANSRSRLTLSYRDSLDYIDGMIGHEVTHTFWRDSSKKFATSLVVPMVTGLVGCGIHRKMTPIIRKYALFLLGAPKSSLQEGLISAKVVIGSVMALGYVQHKMNGLILNASRRYRERRADKGAWNQYGIALFANAHLLLSSNEEKEKERSWFYSHPTYKERLDSAVKRAKERGQKSLADAQLTMEDLIKDQR